MQMKRLAAAAALIVVSAAAQADAIYRWTEYSRPDPGWEQSRGELRLSDEAFFAGRATLNGFPEFPELPPYPNPEITYFGFGARAGVSTNPVLGWTGSQGRYVQVNAEVNVAGTGLIGNMHWYWGDNSTIVAMASDTATGLWTVSNFSSDNPALCEPEDGFFGSFCSGYVGTWQLVSAPVDPGPGGEVPVPATGVLLAVGGAAAFIARRRSVQR